MKKRMIAITAALLVILLAVFLATRSPQPAVRQDNTGPETTAEETAAPAGTEDAGTASAEDRTGEQTGTEERSSEGLTTEPAGAEEEQAAAGTAAEPVHEQPFLVQITENDPSIAYVLVRMPNPVGLLPLPVEGEYTRTLRQTMADGSEAVNVLHLTPDGFWMEEANCEGHDCVGQGEVTLANREERILWNMIICLPHQLSTELITREEAEAMLGQ